MTSKHVEAVAAPGGYLVFHSRATMRSRASASALQQLRFADSRSRMGALLVLQRHVASTIFWRLLGAEWARCDSITKHRSALRKLFAQRLEAGGFPIFEA